jgi:5-hydroxyisourate hydrolase
MTGHLTTHVLDIAYGVPAAGMTIDLWQLDTGGGRVHVKSVVTNADGRTDHPLLAGDDLTVGTYELVFHVGAYFIALGMQLAMLALFDQVPIRFGIADESVNYHIPLLTSPWAYSTYRGS